MKLTKILRQKTEQELDKARREADKVARADYEERRKGAKTEICALIETITPDVQAILAKYGMDVSRATTKTAKEAGLDYYHTVITFHDNAVKNNAEWEELRKAENARYRKQQELIEEFALECELGVEKKDFLDALANLCKRVGE